MISSKLTIMFLAAVAICLATSVACKSTNQEEGDFSSLVQESEVRHFIPSSFNN